jgi:hypothetical protein
MSGEDARPALVNLVLTTCMPGAAAYQATILDLAARGFLTVSDEPGGLRVALAGPSAGPPPEKRERPAEVWSSFSGTWRRVTPGRGPRAPTGTRLADRQPGTPTTSSDHAAPAPPTRA